MADTLVLIACGITGLVVGVFVNVLILRGPTRRSFRPPWSRCGHCNGTAPAAGLVPVAGSMMMGGFCGHCGRRIAWWQPLVELTNAALWMLAALHFGADLVLLAICPFFSGLLALSAIDMAVYRLPDRIDTPLLIGSIPLIVLISLIQHRPHDLIWAAVGGIGYWLLLGLMWLIHPRGMGFGDVKFARVLGLYLGWVHPVLVLYGVMFAGIGGSVVGIGVVIATRNRVRGFPFGPWMAVGCVVAILLSTPLTRNF